jgi:hypothetical protein
MSRSHILCILALAAGFLTFASSAKATTPHQILSHIAQNQTHSWANDGIGIAGMAAKYHSGQRLYVTCGNVSEFARQILAGAGYRSRVVQTLTRDAWDYSNDGHLMTEVYYNGRWQLYDLDFNVRAVDADGHGIGVVAQVAAVRAGTARWQTIATDTLLNENEPNQALLENARRNISDMRVFYRRVMGLPLLPKDPYGQINYGTWYWDASQIQRLSAYPGGSTREVALPSVWMDLTGLTLSQITAYADQKTVLASASSKARKRKCRTRKCRRAQRRALRKAQSVSRPRD